MTKFLNFSGLSTLLKKLKEIFATKVATQKLKDETDPYILNIDYEAELAFKTDTLIGESSSTTGTAVCGIAVVGNS